MATKSLCSIDGCCKSVRARGLCSGHHYRWKKYGDPLNGRAPWGAPAQFLTDVVLTDNGSQCVFWPYSRLANGYPVLRRNGGVSLVHRLVCEAENGPPPTPEHEASHSCGNGHMGCVAKRHLIWKTHAGNMADMVHHGRSNQGQRSWSSKLSADDVRQIRVLSGTISQERIGAMFGVSRGAVSDIVSGRNWAWLE